MHLLHTLVLFYSKKLKFSKEESGMHFGLPCGIRKVGNRLSIWVGIWQCQLTRRVHSSLHCGVCMLCQLLISLGARLDYASVVTGLHCTILR